MAPTCVRHRRIPHQKQMMLRHRREHLKCWAKEFGVARTFRAVIHRRRAARIKAKFAIHAGRH